MSPLKKRKIMSSQLEKEAMSKIFISVGCLMAFPFSGLISTTTILKWN